MEHLQCLCTADSWRFLKGFCKSRYIDRACNGNRQYFWTDFSARIWKVEWQNAHPLWQKDAVYLHWNSHLRCSFHINPPNFPYPSVYKSCTIKAAVPLYIEKIYRKTACSIISSTLSAYVCWIFPLGRPRRSSVSGYPYKMDGIWNKSPPWFQAW